MHAHLYNREYTESDPTCARDKRLLLKALDVTIFILDSPFGFSFPRILQDICCCRRGEGKSFCISLAVLNLDFPHGYGSNFGT